ncbi:MAG TPA: hypothetical protein VIZ65_00340 [Cellvibrionaceae bacterium]
MANASIIIVDDEATPGVLAIKISGYSTAQQKPAIERSPAEELICLLAKTMEQHLLIQLKESVH